MVKVFSLGGSLIRENLDDIEKLGEALDYEEQIVVVTGAGDLNEHQGAVRGQANKGMQDLVGIKATRLNAQTLIPVIEAYPSIPETPEEVQEASESGKDIVMGGLTPGYSTDAVAATVAELLDADLYIATTVDAVYDPHPEDADAEKLEEVGTEKLRELVGDDHRPGSYELIDSTALNLIERSGIETKLFRGSIENLENVAKAEGTHIRTDE
ncbi:MAG: UMP kinase [Candidatus Nanohaloarchaea archaeon]